MALRVLWFGLLVIVGTPVLAQDAPLLSSVGHLAYSLSLNTESEFRYDQYLRELLPALSPLPMFALDQNQGLALTAGSLAVYSTAEMAALSPLPDRLKRTLFLLNWKLGMYSTYAVYREARSQEGSSFEEITLAPFRWESYANPVSLTVLPLMAVGEGVSLWLSQGSSRSPFTTGKAYFGSQEYNPLLGATLAFSNAALIAVQNSYEEAFWRGYVYEEIKRSLQGDWLVANLVGNTLFSLWHIPLQGLNWSIAGVFVSGSLATWAYEVGGLPAAGAAHGMVNALSWLMGFGLSAGVPQGNSPTSAAPGSAPTPLSLSMTPGGFLARFSYR